MRHSWRNHEHTQQFAQLGLGKSGASLCFCLPVMTVSIMAAIRPILIGGLLAAVLVYLAMVDFLKIRIFRRIGLT